MWAGKNRADGKVKTSESWEIFTGQVNEETSAKETARSVIKVCRSRCDDLSERILSQNLAFTEK